MDFKEINNKKHYLYDSKAEFIILCPEVPVRHNWRHGEEGEWVYTDDGFVCQILRKLDIKKDTDKSVPCIRTVCGTFLPRDMKKEMLGKDGIAENIYTFSGTNAGKEQYNSRERNSKELLFARYVASGIDMKEAYRRVYPKAKSGKYIKRRADSLIKTETIQKMIKREIREILDSEGVTPEWIIERYKTIADLAESDTAKLRSLESLSKISGLFAADESKSEQVTIWAGFSPEQLEEVKKHGNPELIAHVKKEEED
jgi:hypothetical protein|tara:strand:+ start:681 stop:1448 length:768 start_codon:yes stop_codon:yes gene_type:complete